MTGIPSFIKVLILNCFFDIDDPFIAEHTMPSCHCPEDKLPVVLSCAVESHRTFYKCNYGNPDLVHYVFEDFQDTATFCRCLTLNVSHDSCLFITLPFID